MKSKVSSKGIYPELSYEIVASLFDAHNKLGRFAKEKQYCELLNGLFTQRGIIFSREKQISFKDLNKFTNQVDFDINNQIILEIKAKIALTKEDFDQINGYNDAGNRKLGILVNFRNKYLKPIRIICS